MLKRQPASDEPLTITIIITIIIIIIIMMMMMIMNKIKRLSLARAPVVCLSCEFNLNSSDWSDSCLPTWPGLARLCPADRWNERLFFISFIALSSAGSAAAAAAADAKSEANWPPPSERTAR